MPHAAQRPCVTCSLIMACLLILLFIIILAYIICFCPRQAYSDTPLDDGEELTLQDYLAEARQLVNLILSNNPEQYSSKSYREAHYGSLQPEEVLIICDKYRVRILVLKRFNPDFQSFRRSSSTCKCL